MKQSHRIVRWMMVIVAGGVLPAFFLRCDKAALNFQRALLQGLGDNVADLIIAQVPSADDASAPIA